jgi:hypothetical protein
MSIVHKLGLGLYHGEKQAYGEEQAYRVRIRDKARYDRKPSWYNVLTWDLTSWLMLRGCDEKRAPPTQQGTMFDRDC